MLSAELIFRLVSQLRDDDYFEKMHDALIEICDTIHAFLNSGREVYPETMEILQHILSLDLHEWNAHDYFMANMHNVFLGRDANGKMVMVSKSPSWCCY